jgi:hypothetical protein
MSALRSYAQALRNAKFAVCPRGVSPASIRLFEAMRAGRCPVVISDAWMPPPRVDWSTCCLRVAEADVEKLPEILREHESEATELGKAAREIWHDQFAPERVVNAIALSALTILSSQNLGVTRRLQLAARGLASREALRTFKAAMVIKSRALRDNADH